MNQTKTLKTRILVSACLMGQPVRYDGRYATKGPDQLIQLQKDGRVILLCPETAAGLPIPRPSAEINNDQVVTEDGQDLTQAFVLGAHKALELCQKHGISLAILKENSPSCGSNFIYDGSFSGKKINGAGKVTELLKANGIRVFSEIEIDKALKLL
ncbi:DUF523 domain-containing protein [Kiloniella antarctica]|uniref:DUF523 domain-containing protein n=1 Tax=Kiloniella antarctica TaxID=1550907 RepID=A0ABW5BIW8_9PROT